jgi:hypothetical protein
VGQKVKQMSTESLNQVLKNKQYSNSNLNNLNNSNSTVEPTTVLVNLPDLIHEGYEPYYIKQLNRLGYARFMELAQKARAGSDTPQKLFSWMLKHNEIVQ